MPQSKRHPARRPQQRPAKRSHGAPAARSSAGRASTAPASTGARRALEVRSVKPLLVIRALPTWLVPVLLAALLVAGLAIPSSWAGLLLLLPAAFLGWLLALSWPVISPVGRALRLVAVLALLAAAVARLVGVF